MIVVSHLYRHAPASLANHRQYARLHGYRHEVVDASAMPQTSPLRTIYRYEGLLHILNSMEEGRLVLLLSEDAAIIDPIPLERLMKGRDRLLVRITSSHVLPQVDVQIWRNTEAVRQIVLQLIKMANSGRQGGAISEAACFTGLETESYMDLIDGVCPVMLAAPSYEPLWSRIPTFAISIDEAPEYPEQKNVTPRFRDVLVEHINSARASAMPFFSFPHYTRASDIHASERSTYNPGHKIAIVTLSTPHIEIYAGISEHNLRRYCEMHGYTLHVHRDIPAEIGLDGAGAWFKPWLLHGYLQYHEWVIWLDADILIADLQQTFEPMLEGRDWLIAHDVGEWLFNAGLMGFRRTARNDEMLRDVMAAITALPDRSDVYTDGGDQPRFITAMKKMFQVSENELVDFISLNTPWMFRRPDSFTVHYFGMWDSMRALMMAHDAALLP